MGEREKLTEEYRERRRVFRERRWAKYDENKKKLESLGFPFTECRNNGIIKVGAFDFYATKGSFIHRKTQVTGKGITELIKALKKEEAAE